MAKSPEQMSAVERKASADKFLDVITKIDDVLEKATGGKPVDFSIFDNILVAIKEQNTLMKQLITDQAAIKETLVEILTWIENSKRGR